MRAKTKQSIPLELVQRIADLTARFAELAEYVRQSALPPQPERATEPQRLARPIELQTENGFVILRSWEVDRSPTPTHGSFCFLVRDPHDTECEVTIEIANRLIIEAAFSTSGRIQVSSSFWICCAERHLADYLTEHDDCPARNQLTVEWLNCEEIMLAIRWEKSD